MSLPEVVHWLEAPPTQVPRMEKQPPERSIPRANVEVALVPVTFRYVAASAPENVEVALPCTTR